MSLPPFLKDVLSGGLPEALDLGRATGVPSDNRGEQSAPIGTNAGTEPAIVSAQNQAIVLPSLPFNITAGQILTGTVVVLGVLTLAKAVK